MPLQASMILGYFKSDRFTIGLSRGGRELGAEGYTRRSVKWELSNTEARCVGTFGPFNVNVEFDGVLLYEGGELVDAYALGRTALPAGTVWDQRLLVSLDQEQGMK